MKIRFSCGKQKHAERIAAAITGSKLRKSQTNDDTWYVEVEKVTMMHEYNRRDVTLYFGSGHFVTIESKLYWSVWASV